MGKKIEMKLISCKRARFVTFSKRRPTLFKMANDLCTLTGCEVAVVVISQSGRTYSFGLPSVEGVTQRFLNESRMPSDQPGGGSVASELNRAYAELAENRRRARVPSWLDTPINELSLEQLITAKESLAKMIEDLEKRSAEISQRQSGKRSCMNANVPDLNFPPNDEI